MGGVVDYLCNSFLPERASGWDLSISAQGVPIKARRNDDDSFAAPEAMVARMDELGIATLVVPVGEPHTGIGPFSFADLTASWGEAEALAETFPGRFASLWSIDPTTGMAGVRRTAEVLDHQWIIGLYTHVHSFDRRFDHPDYYPYYTLCSEREVPVVMQAGTSGGLMPSECGHPIGVDRPALYFPDVSFVLSHTGWPWVAEAIAMALKFPNVYLGTASYPPMHWPPELVSFVKRGGRRKVLFGTNFPTVGHRHAMAQLEGLDLPEDVASNLVEGTARSVFRRLT